MKGLIIRTDRWVLNVLTAYVRRWIERRDYEQHKIDFLIRVEWIQFYALIGWAMIVPAALYIATGAVSNAIVQVALWSFLAALDYFTVQVTIQGLKPLHDYFFAQRENPVVYELVKESCERHFVESRRLRIIMHSLVFAIGCGLCVPALITGGMLEPSAFVWQFLFVNAFVDCLKRYIVHVFDFDPPKKRKKAGQRLTELLQRLWQDLVGDFVPQPVRARTV